MMGPLLLNYVTLGPGHSFVMYANEPHAYLSGEQQGGRRGEEEPQQEQEEGRRGSSSSSILTRREGLMTHGEGE